MPRHDIPEHLGHAFTVADALRAGVGEKRLRGPDLVRPFRGVRARVDSASMAHEQRLQLTPHERRRAVVLEQAWEYSMRMPEHEFFSHETAAILWDVPLPLALPRRLELPPVAVRPDVYDTAFRRPLHVSVLAPHRLPRGAGIRGHEAQPATSRVVRHPQTGLLLTSPATTWAMLGAVLRHPYDLVAAGDHMIRVPRMPGGHTKPVADPIASLAQLEAALFSGRRVGKPAMREALPRLRTGSASRPETWTRLILVDAGLPEPEIDVDVYSNDGRFLGCVDGAYVWAMIAFEYEGDHHRTDVATWNRDIQKHNDLAAHGWRVIRVTRDMVFRQSEQLVRRAADALRSRQ